LYLLNTSRAIKYSRRGYIEGVKWELGFSYFSTGKMGFGALGPGFDHWDSEKVAYNGNGKDVL